mgnify:CR=1 FL=1|jgi:hypothetical protein
MKKFMKATDTLKSWIGSYSSQCDIQVWSPYYASASEFGVQKRSGNERRDAIKKVPKNVKAKRKSVRRK